MCDNRNRAGAFRTLVVKPAPSAVTVARRTARRVGTVGVFGFKIINQYEQGTVFRWGRTLPGIRQPGLTWVNPGADRIRKVNMQIVVATVPAQDAITRDNVTLRVDAVVYYRVVDPVKAIINVQNYACAVS